MWLLLEVINSVVCKAAPWGGKFIIISPVSIVTLALLHPCRIVLVFFFCSLLSGKIKKPIFKSNPPLTWDHSKQLFHLEMAIRQSHTLAHSRTHSNGSKWLGSQMRDHFCTFSGKRWLLPAFISKSLRSNDSEAALALLKLPSTVQDEWNETAN